MAANGHSVLCTHLMRRRYESQAKIEAVSQYVDNKSDVWLVGGGRDGSSGAHMRVAEAGRRHRAARHVAKRAQD